MYKVMKIARYVINYSNEIGSSISNLKLQKLLYYIQAAMLVERGKRCFNEPIVAWEFGPVVTSVYQEYKEYGRRPIPKQSEMREISFDANKMKIVVRKEEKIEEQYRKVIDKVIEAYKEINNPFDLVKKTHKEGPWQDTDINMEIECKKLKEYYTKYREKLYGF